MAGLLRYALDGGLSGLWGRKIVLNCYQLGKIGVLEGVPIMDTRVSPITEQERARRREAFEFARGSVRFEGIVLSAEAEALAERFINGEITLEEHTRLHLAMYRQAQPKAAKQAA